MRLSAVTTRYVEALFQLALERGMLDVIEADVRRLAGEVSDPDVDAFLADAHTEAAATTRPPWDT